MSGRGSREKERKEMEGGRGEEKRQGREEWMSGGGRGEEEC